MMAKRDRSLDSADGGWIRTTTSRPSPGRVERLKASRIWRFHRLRSCARPHALGAITANRLKASPLGEL
jgi:hypothetical protein